MLLTDSLDEAWTTINSEEQHYNIQSPSLTVCSLDWNSADLENLQKRFAHINLVLAAGRLTKRFYYYVTYFIYKILILLLNCT